MRNFLADKLKLYRRDPEEHDYLHGYLHAVGSWALINQDWRTYRQVWRLSDRIMYGHPIYIAR